MIDTLQEAKKHLRENWDQGTTCPCCQQFVKKYVRSLTSAMGWALILLYKHRLDSSVLPAWTHVETMLKNTDCPASIRGDFPKLKYWGLIEPHEKKEGFYSITTSGIAFVLDRHKVQSHVQLYNNKFYGFKGEFWGIKDALKNKFDYTILMNS